MSAPAFLSAVETSGATLSGGSWVVDDGAPLSIKFTPGEAGVANSPYVKHRVLWGDGIMDQSDLLPVGREYRYSHYFNAPGSYSIRVILTNSAGESSDPLGGINEDSLVVVLQRPLPERRKLPVKWSGPALPITTLEATENLVENVFLEASTTLITAAQVNAQSVIVGAPPSEGSTITITQDGKLISSARIIGVVGNTLNLDAALVDSYDAFKSVVTVRTASQGGISLTTRRSPPLNWGLPAVADAELVRASLSLLFGTRPHERVMRPSLGCRIHEQVFEQNDFIGAQLARRYILDAASAEPRADLAGVSAVIDEHDLRIKAAVRFRSFEDEVFDVDLAVPSAFNV